jgi:hypothetical protein
MAFASLSSLLRAGAPVCLNMTGAAGVDPGKVLLACTSVAGPESTLTSQNRLSMIRAMTSPLSLAVSKEILRQSMIGGDKLL